MLIFVTILQVIVGVALSAMILLQSGKSRGLSGAIGGSTDSYLAKGKAKTLDAKLAIDSGVPYPGAWSAAGAAT